MNFDIIGNGIMCLCALIGFIYAASRFFRPKQALFKRMLASALGCLFIGRLYEIVQFIVVGELPEVFQIGPIAYIGCFMFLFSVNYGALDMLIDDRSAELKKYRWLAVLVTLGFDAAAVLILLSPAGTGLRILIAVEEMIIGASAYYSFKHLIFPKAYSDILSSLRLFHVLSLLLAVGMTVENLLWCYGYDGVSGWIAPYFIVWIVMLAIAPAMEWGTKKWTA